jgi:hypothetical protein
LSFADDDGRANARRRLAGVVAGLIYGTDMFLPNLVFHRVVRSELDFLFGAC